MSTTYAPLRRKESFIDENGDLSFEQHEDDVRKRTIDFSYHDEIENESDTISSVTYSDSGVTTSSKSNTTTAITFSITGIGYTDIALTMTSGRVINKRVRVYDKTLWRGSSDYGNR